MTLPDCLFCQSFSVISFSYHCLKPISINTSAFFLEKSRVIQSSRPEKSTLNPITQHHVRQNIKNQPKMIETEDTTFYYGCLVGWIFLLQFVGSVQGYFMKGDIRGWYKNLNRSPLNPPNWVFPIAWTTLYIMLSIAGWKLQMAAQSPELNLIRILYGAQLILNWSWSPVFFNFHKIGLALLIMIPINIFVWGIIIFSWQSLNIISLLMIPYISWISFATYLNYYVWANNSQEKIKGN